MESKTMISGAEKAKYVGKGESKTVRSSKCCSVFGDYFGSTSKCIDFDSAKNVYTESLITWKNKE